MFDSGDSRRMRLFYQLNANYRLQDLSPPAIWSKLPAHEPERFEIKSTYTWFSEQGEAQTTILLTDADKAKRRASEIKEEIRKEIPPVAVGKVSMDFQPGTGGGVDLSLIGDSMDQLREVSTSVLPILSRLTTLRDVRTEKGNGDREVATQVDRIRAKQIRFRCADRGELHPDCVARHAAEGFPCGRKRAAGVAALQRRRCAEPRRSGGLQGARAAAPRFRCCRWCDTDSRETASAVQRENRHTALRITANLADKHDDAGRAQGDAPSAMDGVALWPDTLELRRRFRPRRRRRPAR